MRLPLVNRPSMWPGRGVGRPWLGVVACTAVLAVGCDQTAKPGGATTSGTATATATDSAGPAPEPTATAGNAAPAAPGDVVALELGGDHSFALYGDGTVKAWGSNSDTALGFGKKAQREVRPKRVPLLKYVKSIATAEHHTCATYADGLARCWGRNFGGALGDGTTKDLAFPTQVTDLRGVAEVRVGGTHSCARLTKKNEVRCWGRIVKGERTRPAPVTGLSAVAGLAVGGDSTCAWHADGKASCWDLVMGLKYDPKDAGEGGDGNIKKSPQPLEGLTDVKHIAMSSTHACALHGDGSISCWGFGSRGQLGDGKQGQGHHVLEPQKVAEVSGVDQVAVGDGFTCALLKAGTVLCWGDNPWGQLGMGDKTRRPKPTAVPGVEGVRLLSAGTGHVCALKKDGQLLCWGKNLDGQVGDGAAGLYASRTEPKPVELGE